MTDADASAHTARIYNKHLEDEQMGVSPVQEMTLTRGDLTWFTPNWFQTHQLENSTQDFCCTVQGFQYADDDDVHWPYMQFKVGAPSMTRDADQRNDTPKERKAPAQVPTSTSSLAEPLCCKNHLCSRLRREGVCGPCGPLSWIPRQAATADGTDQFVCKPCL